MSLNDVLPQELNKEQDIKQKRSKYIYHDEVLYQHIGLSGVAGSCSIPSLVALGSNPCQCIVDCRLQYRVGW
jgi:hypothetical protein